MTVTKGFCLHIDFNTINNDDKQLFIPYLVIEEMKDEWARYCDDHVWLQ
ncbi:MAG: hypothetical protein SOZ08_09240 [Erysipelotrichaceae bacterium]|nr:hypothetical protein [Erysipelotrichaceae bacterium]